MATMRLVPSTYYLSNSSYLSVSNANNMYDDTDSTNYATIRNTRTSTSSYYIYLRGFNFDDVPSNAIVSDITIKLKAYHSGGNTSTIYCYDGTTQVSSAGSTTALTTSVTTKTFTNTTIDWDTLKGYGSDFGIRINCRRSSKNTTSYIYIYGAEIEVTYTIPVYHTITASGDGNLEPSGVASILEGDDYTLTISGITPIVTDNGVDVTSQLVPSSSGTTTLIPEGNTNDGFTLSNIDNAYSDADSTNYATLELSGSSSGTIYFDLSALNIPSSATIEGVSCEVTLQYDRNNSSSGYTASCQMYTGSTAKGSSQSIVSAGGSDVAKTTFNLIVGSWTKNELSSARLYITATNSARSTHRFLYVYGVSFNITYSIDGVIYTYTISNVISNHVIIVSSATSKIYIKESGVWVEYTKGYKKVNGVWVEQNLNTLFNSTTNYIHG